MDNDGRITVLINGVNMCISRERLYFYYTIYIFLLLIYCYVLIPFLCRPQNHHRWRSSRDHSRRRAMAWRHSIVGLAAIRGQPSSGGRTTRRCRIRWIGMRSRTGWLATARPVRFYASSRPGRTGTTLCTSVSPRTEWATQSAPTPNSKCMMVSARAGAPSYDRSFFPCIIVSYIRGFSPLPDPGWFPPPSRAFGFFADHLHTPGPTFSVQKDRTR